MKGAIECANRVSTVSPSYAQEILDPWYSHGLDTILNQRSWKLSGILNGIDTVSYDPAADQSLFANYSAEDPAGKIKNKLGLQEYMGLPVREDVPLMGMVSRLVSHKGLDLVKAVLDELLETTDMQVIVLGSGDWEYENFFREAAARHPGKLLQSSQTALFVVLPGFELSISFSFAECAFLQEVKLRAFGSNRCPHSATKFHLLHPTEEYYTCSAFFDVTYESISPH